MLNTIKTFFENNFLSDESVATEEQRLQLATAALLIEMSLQDNMEHTEEVQAVKQALQKKFLLSVQESAALYDNARHAVNNATDYHEFTRLIAKHFTQPQKIKLIEYLWMVAYADRQLDKYEEHMIRRIADLIHVSHKDFMQAKHRVVDQTV